MSDNEKKYPWIKSIFNHKNKDEDAVNDVYAGPEKDDIVYPVYAGPEVINKVNARPFECVYAGPEFFNNNGEKPIGVQYDPSDYSEDAPTERVYAGPEYYYRRKNESGEIDPAQTAYTVQIKRAKVCSSCGFKLTEEWLFCPECGTPIPKVEEDG